MRIGIIKEVKDNEHRVGLTPEGAQTLAESGHEVLIEAGAGQGCGFRDQDYRAARARLVATEAAWSAELVVKVKEPVAAEYPRLRGQILFGFLHLAGVDRGLTEALLASGTTAVAYETVADEHGRRPLLAPMSAIAGTMAPLVGAAHLSKRSGGRGVLLGEVLGRRHGKVLIIGDGVVGGHAARVATALAAEVYMFGLDPALTEAWRERIGRELRYVPSTPEHISGHLVDADLLIGAVLIQAARAPHVVSVEMVKRLPEGSVIVDVSIDQGGCVATSRPTSHSAPVFVEHGAVHYCVTNMPGAYPRTSTLALTEATLPYVRRLADGGTAALAADHGLASGVNVFQGHITCRPVAEALGLHDRYRPFAELVRAP